MNAASKIAICAASVVSIVAVATQAHHSYGEYDRTKQFSIAGKVTQVVWVNPHPMVHVQTQTAEIYAVELQGLSVLDRAGVRKENFAVGNDIVVTGARAHDPAVFKMSLIREISVPSKNWHWVRQQTGNASTQNTSTSQ
jgi:hypothetical protein